jgi:hypothetical protein
MLGSATGHEMGGILKEHPRRHAFGMLKSGLIEKRAITNPMLEKVGFEGLS